MTENTIEEQTEFKATLTFEDVVLKKVTGMAIAEVPGILGLSGNLFSDFANRFRDNEDLTKGIGVEVGKKQIAVDVSVDCEYGKDISKIFEEATEKVKQVINHTTGLTLIEFNMKIDDIMTKEQYGQKKKTQMKE